MATAWLAWSSSVHPLSQGSCRELHSCGFDRADCPDVMSCKAHDNDQFTGETTPTFFKQLLADEGLDVEFDVGGQFKLGKQLPFKAKVMCPRT